MFVSFYNFFVTIRDCLFAKCQYLQNSYKHLQTHLQTLTKVTFVTILEIVGQTREHLGPVFRTCLENDDLQFGCRFCERQDTASRCLLN